MEMALRKEKVALVTGAASGIGRAAALAFAQEGARVIVSDIHANGGEGTARTIRDTGKPAHFVQADVSKTADVEHLLEQTIALWAARLRFQ